MNTDIIAGKWKQAIGTFKEKWGQLTDSDLTAIEGKRDNLVGKLQERYGWARDRAETEVQEFEKAL